MVVFWTKVHIPLKECERSMTAYTSYRSHMAKLRYLPDGGSDKELSTSCATYCAPVVVIATCEWMRNSAKVPSLLAPSPTDLKVFQENLWREFGDPMVHMDVHVSSTKNTDAARLRAPHLNMGARQMFDYLVFRNRSWTENLGDLTYCLRLTTASN